MEVGIKIKKYLEENGISQAYMSRVTQIDSVKLNLSLNGNRKLTFDEYSIICGALKLNTDYFIKPRKPINGKGKKEQKFVHN